MNQETERAGRGRLVDCRLWGDLAGSYIIMAMAEDKRDNTLQMLRRYLRCLFCGPLACWR